MSRNNKMIGSFEGDSSSSLLSFLIRKEEYHRPRRPDPDTIHYLRSLPLEEAVAHDEIQAFLQHQQQQQQQQGKEDENDVEEEMIEYPSSLAACLSAIDEIKNEIASLAGDEHGATGIETLARIALPYSELAARKLLYYACCSAAASSATSGMTLLIRNNNDNHHHQKEIVSGIAPVGAAAGTNARQSYAVHLALHRYGSHVLQTLLSLCICNHSSNSSSNNSSTIDLALHKDGPGPGFVTPDELDILPSLSELLLQLQQDLSPHAVQLSVHMCGSHVLRALLCALGGVQIVDSRGGGAVKAGGEYLDQQQEHGGNGKTSKKKKKRGKGASTGGGGGGGGGGSDPMQMFFVANSRIPSPHKNAHIRQALLQLTQAITGSSGDHGGLNVVKPPGELQQRACHASAAPVLILLLRVLTYVDASDEWKSKLLLLPSSSTTLSTTPSTSASFANHHLCLLRQEPHFENGSAAHSLAKQLLCWTSTSDYHHHHDNNGKNNNNKVGGKWASDVIYGLSGEARGSHVLDALFRLSPDDFYQSILEAGDFFSTPTLKEYVEHDVSNFVVQTLLATIHTTNQAETMVQAIAPIVSSGLVLQVAKRRRGILWRLTEMAATHNIGQVQVMQSLQEGLKAIQDASAAGEGVNSSSSSSSSSSNLDECAARVLLDMKRPDSTETGRLGLNVEGTRALYHLLRFKPRLCKPVVNSLVALSPSDLELLAKDGLGSRCVWDAILEWPASTKNTMQAKVLRKLLDKLTGRWVSLATDRIGHHVVRKVFRCLGDINDRENLVKELVKGIHRLRANAMGRAILEASAVEEYGNDGGGAAEWRKIIKKKMEKEEWLEEIVHKNNGNSSSDATGTGARVAGITFSTNEKKRHHSESETSERSKKSRGEAAVTVDSIMEAISIPASATSAKKKKKS
jgi:Pumilio-family RNA binding repeat